MRRSLRLIKTLPNTSDAKTCLRACVALRSLYICGLFVSMLLAVSAMQAQEAGSTAENATTVQAPEQSQQPDQAQNSSTQSSQASGSNTQQSNSANPAISGSELVTLRGSVHDAITGAPLARVLVRINGTAMNGALTDGAGRFEIPNVPVGPQQIEIQKPGYRDPNDDNWQMSMKNLLVAVGMSALEFQLEKQSVITGEIQLSTGEPAVNITVRLMCEQYNSGRKHWANMEQTKTDSHGRYRFAHLLSNNYIVVAGPELLQAENQNNEADQTLPQIDGYPAVFYPSAREVSDAQVIHLGAAQELEANITLRLEPFYLVNVQTSMPRKNMGSNESGSGVLIYDNQSVPTFYSASFNAKKQQAQFYLPDGSYHLYGFIYAPASQDISTTNKQLIPTSAPAVREVLKLSSAIDVKGAPIHLQLPLRVFGSGTVHVYQTHVPPSNDIHKSDDSQTMLREDSGLMASSLWELGGGSAGGSLLNDTSTGVHSYHQLFPGSYTFAYISLSSSLCVASLTVNGVELGSAPLKISADEAMPDINITLTGDCAQLTVKLPTAVATPKPGIENSYTSYLVPQFVTASDYGSRVLRASTGAEATWKQLPPGTYKLYLLDVEREFDWSNSAELQAHTLSTQTVTLEAGDKKTVIVEVPAK